MFLRAYDSLGNLECHPRTHPKHLLVSLWLEGQQWEHDFPLQPVITQLSGHCPVTQAPQPQTGTEEAVAPQVG